MSILITNRLYSQFIVLDKKNESYLGRANYLTCLPYSSFAQQRGGGGEKNKKNKK